MDLLLGIDLGSTTIKAVAYDRKGAVASRGAHPTERRHPSAEHPQWCVWDPDQIWGGVCAAVREAVAGIANPRAIRGVAVTGMGMDGCPVDDRGQWLYPMISWHDPRTTPQLKWWRRQIGAQRQFAVGGNPLWHINSALRMLWVMEHESAVFARTEKWLLIEDYVNQRLCGRAATDPSMASCTLLYDLRQGGWSEELLAASGIPRRILPEVLPSGSRLGEVSAAAAEATGLPAGTPVVLGGHDHLCGALPVGAFEPGVVLDVTGTWESIQTATAQPPLDDALRQAGITVQAHVAPLRFAVWGGNPAGEMIEWFRRELGRSFTAPAEEEAPSWEALAAAAEQSPLGARGVLFLPHMAGAHCPVVDDAARGAFVGLRPIVTAGDLVRAVIEGLNYQTLDILQAMESCLGHPLSRLVAVGGATRNRFWMQNKADVADRPVEIAAVEDASPLGAALLAAVGVGLDARLEDAVGRIARPTETIFPRPDAAREYARRFPLYRQLYPALRQVHAAGE